MNKQIYGFFCAERNFLELCIVLAGQCPGMSNRTGARGCWTGRVSGDVGTADARRRIYELRTRILQRDESETYYYIFAFPVGPGGV